MLFQGCGTAMVTPFRKDGSLDEHTLRSLVKRQIEDGINFLVPCGTSGESPTLSHKEHLRVVEITIEEAAEGARMDTRRYAKRQLTWFRNQMKDWPSASPKEAQKALEKQLASA